MRTLDTFVRMNSVPLLSMSRKHRENLENHRKSYRKTRKISQKPREKPQKPREKLWKIIENLEENLVSN